jgi:hypothetical protein
VSRGDCVAVCVLGLGFRVCVLGHTVLRKTDALLSREVTGKPTVHKLRRSVWDECIGPIHHIPLYIPIISASQR